MNVLARQEIWMLRAVQTCLVLVCLLPLVVSYSTVYPFVVGKALFARSLIEIAFAGWLLLAWRCPQYRPRPSFILLALLAWLAVSLAAAQAGVNPTRSLWSSYSRMHGVVELAHWCAFSIVAASVFRSFSDWHRLLIVNLAVGAVVSALALARYLGFIDWIFVFSEPVRAGSTLGSGLFLGAYTVMTAGLGAALLMRPWRSGRYWPGAWTYSLLAGLVGLNFAAMWISGARSPLLGAATMVFVFVVGMLLFDRRTVILKAALGLLAVILTLSAVGLLSDRLGIATESGVMFKRLASAASGEDKSIAGRMNTLQLGLEAYRERPVLGWGPENFRSAWGRHVTAEQYSGRTVDQAHNKALDTLVSTGTAGFFVYTVLWLALVLTAVRLALAREGPDRRFALAMTAALAGYVAVSFFLFDTQSFMLPFAILVGFFASQEHGGVGLISAWPEWARGLMSKLEHFGSRPYVVPMASTLVGIALFFSLVQFNVRPFMGAQLFEPRGPWPEILASARESYEAFPALSHTRRTEMIVNTTNVMPDLPASELDAVIGQIGREFELGLAAEPHDWNVHYLAVSFYQAASRRDSQYRELALYHLAQLREVAPHSPFSRQFPDLLAELSDNRRTGSGG